MNDYILYDKLNKYLCSIIFNYIDYTREKLNELYEHDAEQLKIKYDEDLKNLKIMCDTEKDLSIQRKIPYSNKNYNRVMDNLLHKTLSLKFKCDTNRCIYKTKHYGTINNYIWF